VRDARRTVVAWASLFLAAFAPLSLAQAPVEPVGSVTVSVRGLDGPLRENVLAHLGVADLARRGGVLARLDPRRTAPEVTFEDLRRRHAAAPAEIREALVPYGYYLPEIDAQLIETNGGYEARYTIVPGPPARIRDVVVRVEGEGAATQALRRALESIELREGDRLIHARYEAARESIFDAAYDEGYLRARWQTREIRVSPDRLAADIRLVLETGPRFYFGELEIQAERLSPDFTARFTDIRPGEPYDVRRLLALQLLLNDTEYFASVEIRADPADADAGNRIPVVVRTEPARPQRYTVGLGYATDTGPRFNFGMLLRRVNRYGHRFRSELLLSSLETAVAGRYAIPIRNVASDLLDFSLTARELEIGDAESTQYALGVSQYVGWRGFRRRAYLQLQREEFQFGDEPTQATRLFYPGLTLTRDTGDDMLYPRRGYSVQLDLRGGGEGLVSDVSFLRFKADARWVRALSERARLLVRAEAGALRTGSFDRLPPTQRFFAGGDRSVRGYEYQMIGEHNAAGDVIGGRYMLVGSVEAERLLFGDFGLAAFVDVGDAFISSFDAKVGAGAGIRWRSPVGMVRLDLAHPFHSEESVRFHLSIGADL
jgi:translocation and assembly module TamA